MKNIIVMFVLLLFSCKKEVKLPIPANEGSMSIIVTDKNNNIQTIKYENTFIDIQSLPSNDLPSLVGIGIIAESNNIFTTAVSFTRNKAFPFEYYQAGASGYSIFTQGEYGVNTFSKTESLLFSIPSNDINRGRERLLITKDDKDSLAGSFEIRLVDKKIPVPDTVRMKGSFSIAKKGRF